ncbi:hypothetical protein V492_07679, partial [Pseudogymnoascus sp. VKM F-4246]
MADNSKMPAPSRVGSVLVNHRLSQVNMHLSTQVDTLQSEHKTIIERLRDQVEQAIPSQMQFLNSSLGGTEQKLRVEVQTLKDEFTTTQQAHKQEVTHILKESDEKRGNENHNYKQELLHILKEHDENRGAENRTYKQELTHILHENDEKRRVENELLRSQMEDVQRRHDQMSERLKALEAAIQSSQPAVGSDRRRKKARTSKSTTKEIAQPSSYPEIDPSQTPAPLFGTPALPAQVPAQAQPAPSPFQALAPAPVLIPALDPAGDSVHVPIIPRFHSGNIQQGALGLHEYASAFAPYIADVRVAARSTNNPSLERNAIGQFVVGMNTSGDRTRLATELERRKLAFIDRKKGAVKFFLPAHLIHAVLWAMLLDHYPDGVGEADRVVGHVGGEEEHGAFGDGEGAGYAVVDDFEEERAA